MNYIVVIDVGVLEMGTRRRCHFPLLAHDTPCVVSSTFDPLLRGTLPRIGRETRTETMVFKAGEVLHIP